MRKILASLGILIALSAPALAQESEHPHWIEDRPQEGLPFMRPTAYFFAHVSKYICGNFLTIPEQTQCRNETQGLQQKWHNYVLRLRATNVTVDLDYFIDRYTLLTYEADAAQRQFHLRYIRLMPPFDFLPGTLRPVPIAPGQ